MWFTLNREKNILEPNDDITLFRASRILTGTHKETNDGVFEFQPDGRSVKFEYFGDERTYTVGEYGFPYVSLNNDVGEIIADLQERIDTVKEWVKSNKVVSFELK